MDSFNTEMNEMKVGTGEPGNPVLAVQCNYEKIYAVMEVCRMNALYFLGRLMCL